MQLAIHLGGRPAVVGPPRPGRTWATYACSRRLRRVRRPRSQRRSPWTRSRFRRRLVISPLKATVKRPKRHLSQKKPRQFLRRMEECHHERGSKAHPLRTPPAVHTARDRPAPAGKWGREEGLLRSVGARASLRSATTPEFPLIRAGCSRPRLRVCPKHRHRRLAWRPTSERRHPKPQRPALRRP